MYFEYKTLEVDRAGLLELENMFNEFTCAHPAQLHLTSFWLEKHHTPSITRNIHYILDCEGAVREIEEHIDITRRFHQEFLKKAPSLIDMPDPSGPLLGMYNTKIQSEYVQEAQPTTATTQSLKAKPI